MNARIVNDLDLLRHGLSAYDDTGGVGSGRHQRAALWPFIEFSSTFPTHRTLRAQVPINAVQSRIDWYPGSLFTFLGLFCGFRRNLHRNLLLLLGRGRGRCRTAFLRLGPRLLSLAHCRACRSSSFFLRRLLSPLQFARAFERSHSFALSIADDDFAGFLHALANVVREARAISGVLAVEGAIAKPLHLRPWPVAQSRGNREEMQLGIPNLWRELLEWRQVIEDPHRPPVGSDHEIVFPRLQIEVIHGAVRQAKSHQIPMTAIVPGDIRAIFQAGVVHVRIAAVLANDMGVNVGREIARNGLPTRAVIGGPVQVRLEVAEVVAIDGNDRLAGVVGRYINTLDAAPVLHARNFPGHISPVRAAIAGDMHQTIVSADPDHVGIFLRKSDSEDGVISFSPGTVLNHRAAGGLLLALIIAREVRTDGLPSAPAVLAAE